MKLRFKIGDLISGHIHTDAPDITLLILSVIEDRGPGSIYKVIHGDEIMHLNATYADCYFEKLNDT